MRRLSPIESVIITGSSFARLLTVQFLKSLARQLRVLQKTTRCLAHLLLQNLYGVALPIAWFNFAGRPCFCEEEGIFAEFIFRCEEVVAWHLFLRALLGQSVFLLYSQRLQDDALAVPAFIAGVAQLARASGPPDSSRFESWRRYCRAVRLPFR